MFGRSGNVNAGQAIAAAVACRRPVNSPPQAGLKRHPWPG